MFVAEIKAEKLKESRSEMCLCVRIHKVRLLAGIIAIALFYVLLIIYYDLDAWRFGTIQFGRKRSFDDASVQLDEKKKKILFWNGMWGDETFYFGKVDLFERCPGAGSYCSGTHERALISVDDFDAILFHGSELDFHDVPKTRRERQNYIFVNLESPENHPISYWRFDNDFFNLTMTYRLDSDIVWPYAHVRNIEEGGVVAPRLGTVWDTVPRNRTVLSGTSPGTMRYMRDKATLIKTRRNKTKTAVWFVSNCNSHSGREKYVNELAMHVDVDIFGLCGKGLQCPRNRNCFREVVEPDYYFYLAFENSMCQDYVTEKFYNALQYDVVPVVYGGANYSRFAPPGSYINSLDFDSPMELAIYLKRLISQPSEYDKYFEWKQRYEIVDPLGHVICQLCQYLQEHNTTKSYLPLSAWYATDKCPLQKTLTDLPYVTRRNLKNRHLPCRLLNFFVPYK